jgi:hypothetical protein
MPSGAKWLSVVMKLMNRRTSKYQNEAVPSYGSQLGC